MTPRACLLLVCAFVVAVCLVPTASASADVTVSPALAVSSPSNDSCANYTTCDSCTSVSGCAFCSNSDPTVPNSCMLSTSTTCTSFVGNLASLVTSIDECAAPGDSCTNSAYQTSCGKCNAAPRELNCGWCSGGVDGGNSSLSCVSGSEAGPTSYTCPSVAWASVSWGACDSDQENCNSFSSNGCSDCTLVGTSCGYCESTGKCEYVATGGSEPSLQNCPVNATSSFITIEVQCADFDDPCTPYTTCSSCSDETTALNCGWCSGTNACMTSTTLDNGSMSGSCSGSDWAGATCPSDPCSIMTSCIDCAGYMDGCAWCDGTCANSSVATCANDDWVYESQECPGSGGGGGGGGGLYAAGVYYSAVLLMTPCIVVPVVVQIIRRFSPVPPLDSALLDGGVPQSVTPFYLLLLVLGVGGFALKLAALIWDKWDAATDASFGVIFASVDGISFNYFNECGSATCIFQTIGSLLTLVTGAVTSLASVVLFIGAIASLRGTEFAVRQLLTLWIAAAMGVLMTGSALTFWAAFHVPQQSMSHLAISWFLMLGALFIDLLAVAAQRSVIRRTSRTRPPTGEVNVTIFGQPRHTADDYHQPLMA